MIAATMSAGPATGKPLIERNPALVGFRSLNGQSEYPVGDFPLGCPQGRDAGRPTSVVARYAGLPGRIAEAGARMAAAAAWLPYLRWPGLGEGGTPLMALPPPAKLAEYRIKAEWMNPTGSHKDRMSPLSVARALERGAPGIACASSGNAGVSLAAYAARAGLPARVVVGEAVPPATRRILACYGAEVVESAGGTARWQILASMVRDEGWHSATNFALPASGSDAWGVEAYKTVALELAAECPGGIDAVLVPTARGDLAWGIHIGFGAMRQAGLWPHPEPRLIAVEPFPRLQSVLAGRARSTDQFPGSTKQASTAGATTTDQALRAVRDSGGTAIAIDDDAAAQARAALARQGVLLELCAAAGHAAVPRLAAQGVLGPGDKVVLIGTASGRMA